MKRTFLLIAILINTLQIFSQKENKHIRAGNEDYFAKNYGNSEVSYQKALQNNPESYEAKFNLGDAFYKQKKYKEAIEEFNTIAKNENDKNKLGQLYYNIGNSELKQTEDLLKNQKLDEALKTIDKSINSYKKSLINNPKDKEAKYNLAYAKYLKKQLENQKNQQDKNNQNQDNKDNKDGDKNQQDKNNKDNNDNQDQKDKNKPSENDSDGDGIPDKVEKDQPKQNNQISREDALRLLEAIENDEKNIQDKLKKRKVKVVPVKSGKDW